MKTLIYDNECPLCAAYTTAFVKTGILDKEGRTSFDDAGTEVLKCIDPNRSKNEIPLIDSASGKTWYGIDALLELMGAKMKWVKIIGELPLVNWCLKKMYKLISYNRK